MAKRMADLKAIQSLETIILASVFFYEAKENVKNILTNKRNLGKGYLFALRHMYIRVSLQLCSVFVLLHKFIGLFNIRK